MGAISGAILITVIRELLNLTIGSTVSQIVFGLLLIVTILFLPNGILGLIKAKTRSKTSNKVVIGGTQ